MVDPRRLCRQAISLRIRIRSEASRFESGSSNSRILGSRAIARPIATRWRCPPESAFGPEVGGFWKRPEIRVFASYTDWDVELNRFTVEDSFGNDGFTGGQWSFGVQSEIWL